MAVTTAPVLVSPQDSEPFHIKADSSNFASGAIFSQQLPGEEKWHPIAFYSKSLSPVEQNYKIYDKEMLIIIHALEEWRHFLKGAQHPVEIWTDHKNLEYFMTAKKLNCRQACWSLVKDVQSRSGVTRSGRELTTKVGEQPWPQLMHYASICCRMCGCIFQEDGIVVRSAGEEWYID